MTKDELIEYNKRTLDRLNASTPYLDDRVPKCKKCNDKTYILKFKNDDPLNEMVAIDCECLPTKINERKIEKSGLKSQVEKLTFDNYTTNTSWKKTIKKQALEYVSNLDSNYWFIISGAIGSGKTHICSAISKEFIVSNKTFKYFKFAEDMPLLSSKLNNFNVDIMLSAKEELDELKEVEVLYIDDFLKNTRSNNEWVFALIDYRYSNNKKTIISTEYSYQDMANIDEAIASRLKEKANQYWLHIKQEDGKNQRL